MALMGQFSYVKTSYSLKSDLFSITVKQGLQEHYSGEYSSLRQVYFYKGSVVYGVCYLWDMFEVLSHRLELTDSREELITQFLNKYSRHGQQDPAKLDSVNVVYIIMESLNAICLVKKSEVRT